MSIVPARVLKSRCRYPVAAIGPLGAAFAVVGAAQRVGLHTHQRLNKRRQQSTQQIRARGELVGQQLLNIDMVGRGHHVVLLRVTWRSFEGSRDDRPLPSYDTPPTGGNPYTTSMDVTRSRRAVRGVLDWPVHPAWARDSGSAAPSSSSWSPRLPSAVCAYRSDSLARSLAPAPVWRLAKGRPCSSPWAHSYFGQGGGRSQLIACC